MYATAKASAAKYISMQIVSKHKYNVFRVASAILPSYKYLDLTTETPINASSRTIASIIPIIKQNTRTETSRSSLGKNCHISCACAYKETRYIIFFALPANYKRQTKK